MASGSGDDEAKARGGSWRLVGPAARLSATRCRLVYCSLGRDADVCLFHVRGEFFAMDARCAHSGGPLCEGDIEEADGVLQVFCPWHDYDFDLRTGKSGTSLQVREPRPPTRPFCCLYADALLFSLHHIHSLFLLLYTSCRRSIKIKDFHRRRIIPFYF
uniref:Si:ch211-212d10.2 n=1 Tax=Gasterosteus aculeatus aculeatus TaxID=481459 RepID=A0AAQ4PS80_GASAC